MTTVTTNLPSKNAETAAALLRVVNGGLFTFHGLFKAVVFTFAGTAAYFQSIGLPGFLAYVTILVEVLGGLALLAGYKTRLVSLVMIPVLLGAAYFGHGVNGFVFSNPNGGWEYPAFWAVVMAVQALLGAGAYSVDNR